MQFPQTSPNDSAPSSGTVIDDSRDVDSPVIDVRDGPTTPDPTISVNWVDHRAEPLLWGHSARLSPRNECMIRCGLASIFVINGLVALLRPEEFSGLLAGNPLAGRLPSAIQSVAVTLAGLNDLALAGALLLSRHRVLVMQWAALWLAVVAITKAMNEVF